MTYDCEDYKLLTITVAYNYNGPILITYENRVTRINMNM
jgi:hypothetical protein